MELYDSRLTVFAVHNVHLRLTLIPMYDAHPYFSLKNLGVKVCIIHGKVRYVVLNY